MTRDQFIEALPPHLFRRTSHVLMKRSVPCADEVSPAKPRVIMFDVVTKTQVSYVGNSEGPCGSAVEIIQGDIKTEAHTGYRIEFKKNRPPEVVVLKVIPGTDSLASYKLSYAGRNAPTHEAIEQANCIKCHTEKMHPRWNKGENIWPNAWGAFDGGLKLGTDEEAEFAEFLKNSACLLTTV